MKMIDDLTLTLAPADVHAILSRPITKNQIPPQWRWHHRTLLALRERLLDHRARLAAEAIAAAEPLDAADLAAEDFEHDLALGQLSGEQDVLYEIQAALNRIRAGTYGLCEVTGEPIPKPRLRAVPWTRFCQAVEERLENDGTLHAPHLGELRSIYQVVARSADADVPEEEEGTL